jgi:hypothetical protein
MTEGGGSVGVIMTVNLGRVLETLHRFSDVEFPRVTATSVSTPTYVE